MDYTIVEMRLWMITVTTMSTLVPEEVRWKNHSHWMWTIGANLVRALHVVHARADAVATNLSLFFLSSSSFFLSSFHILFSQKGFA